MSGAARRARVVAPVVLWGAVVAASQDTPGPPSFRAASAMVRVDVNVSERGRAVRGLTIGDFELLEDGVRQPIVDLSYETVPIDVTIALDVSGSVNGALLEQLQRAVEQVSRRLGPDDRIKLLTFNMRVQRAFDFAAAGSGLQAALAGIQAGGSTSLYDAIAVALGTPAPSDRRQLIIVFSDGEDTMSVTGTDVLLQVAQRTAGTVTFVRPPLGFPSSRPVLPSTPSLTAQSSTAARTGSGPAVTSTVSRDQQRHWQFQAQLASETGGTVVPLGVSELQLRNSFSRVLDEFRASYVLHFQPVSAANGGFHALQVRVLGREGVAVRARRGYFR
jgi:VWFA-related protein